MLNETRIGPVFGADGNTTTARAGRASETIVQDLHSRLFESNFRENLFCFGISTTALAAANAIATGVTATAQPVIGVWNPVTSGKNLFIQKTVLTCTAIANTAVSPAGFMYLVSTNQSSITTGSNPFSCKTLAQTGSVAKAFAMATALTGLSGSLVVMRPVAIGTINAAGPSTAITQPIGSNEELVDGGIIVPPGGVLAVMCAAATTTVSYNTGMVWEEFPI